MAKPNGRRIIDSRRNPTTVEERKEVWKEGRKEGRKELRYVRRIRQ